MFTAAAFAVLVTMTLAMIRALKGPTVYDRILALNVFGTKTVLLIAVLGFLAGRPDFLDLALVYALINFIGVIAMLKFFEYGNLATAGVEVDGSPSGASAATEAISGGPSEGGDGWS